MQTTTGRNKTVAQRQGAPRFPCFLPLARLLTFLGRGPRLSSPACRHCAWLRKNGAPLTGMLAANKRLRTRNTHPQDMVALRAPSRDLHTLRTSHGWVPLRLFIGFMAACEPAELGYPLSTATHRVHVVS